MVDFINGQKRGNLHAVWHHKSPFQYNNTFQKKTLVWERSEKNENKKNLNVFTLKSPRASDQPKRNKRKGGKGEGKKGKLKWKQKKEMKMKEGRGREKRKKKEKKMLVKNETKQKKT